MKQLNIPILKATLALIVGIVVSNYTLIAPYLILYFVLGLFITLIGLHLISKKINRSGIGFGLGILLLFFGIGIVIVKLHDPLQSTTHYNYQQKEQTQILLFSVDQILKPTLYQDKYVVSLKQKNKAPASGKLLLNITKDSLPAPLRIGNWYYSHTPILEVPFPKNPYQFDYGAYLNNNHIYGQLSIDREDILQSQKASKGLKVWSSRFRESVQKKLNKHAFSPSQLAIMNALLIGQRQGIDRQMSDQYAAAGMIHILAVSGLHVGIILLILRFITKPIAARKLRLLRSGIIIVCIWCFAFISGLSPSVLRAATMFSFLEIGTALGGKRESSNALLFSALVLLVIDPSLLYNVGFQLSYLAVIAILWVQPWLSGFYKPRYYLDRLLWGTATVTIAAQMGVMPLSLYYFHQFPGLFLVSNLLVIPFLGVLLGIGILVVVLAMGNILPDQLVTFYGMIIDLLNGFVGWVASQEAFLFKNITISATMAIMSYALLITSIYVLKKYRYKRAMLWGVSALLFIGALVFEKMYPEDLHLAILHKSRQSTISIYKKNVLQLHVQDTSYTYASDSRIKAYRDALPIDSVVMRKMGDYFRFKQKEILVIDSLGVYKVKDLSPDYILLSQSPNINLNRLITLYPRATIIADGNNYKSDILRWKATCRKLKIPFHSTYEKGAFIIK